MIEGKIIPTKRHYMVKSEQKAVMFALVDRPQTKVLMLLPSCHARSVPLLPWLHTQKSKILKDGKYIQIYIVSVK